jgi:hypothetical protein|tara:strand:- start:74 stop:340 length:267 start_codon:yes stop_codon:yes gene_type:complete
LEEASLCQLRPDHQLDHLAALGSVIVLVMDHAKAPDKGTTAREPITVFSMNRRSLTPERGDSASRVNASKPTKKQPELITWEEIIGKR